MARGTTFNALVNRLRAEAGRSSNPNLGVSEEDKLQNAINHVYQELYLGFSWPHLRKVFPKIVLQAGDRYYDFPVGLNSERIEAVTAWSGTVRWPLDRGIDWQHYETYSSEDNERSDPPQRWDIRWTGTEDQVEVWPMPASNGHGLQFIGIQDAPRLVHDADVCLLDDEVVVLFACAEIIVDEKQAEKKLKLAQDRLNMLFGRSHAATGPYQLGLGRQPDTYQPVVLRVGR